ncbi:MAG: VUT family protein, partial [Mesorhizobium sp.]
MSFVSRYLSFVAAMALVVVASNVLVQFPLQGAIGGLSLADILTWGAFTYPFSFLVTDLANRRYGPAVARRIVFVGFTAAVICSVVIPPLLFRYGLIEFETAADRLVRIAAASGTAFLIAQLLDVTVFNRLRRQSWWRAPIVGTLVGSVFD